eukprot:3404422-Rhodomonas_salina.7
MDEDLKVGSAIRLHASCTRYAHSVPLSAYARALCGTEMGVRCAAVSLMRCPAYAATVLAKSGTDLRATVPAKAGTERRVCCYQATGGVLCRPYGR